MGLTCRGSGPSTSPSSGTAPDALALGVGDVLRGQLAVEPRVEAQLAHRQQVGQRRAEGRPLEQVQRRVGAQRRGLRRVADAAMRAASASVSARPAAPSPSTAVSGYRVPSEAVSKAPDRRAAPVPTPPATTTAVPRPKSTLRRRTGRSAMAGIDLIASRLRPRRWDVAFPAAVAASGTCAASGAGGRSRLGKIKSIMSASASASARHSNECQCGGVVPDGDQPCAAP